MKKITDAGFRTMSNSEAIDHSPERQLWAEVLLRAYGEAVRGIRTGCDINPGSRFSAQSQAIAFCTGGGDWQQSRETICTLLDIDPEQFRLAALNAIEANPR